jgi:hypothetical protein
MQKQTQKKYNGILSEGSKDVCFVQLTADALLISDIYISLGPKNIFKRFFHNIV